MAIINGMYLHVTDESVARDVDATSHPVESGVPLTDTVRVTAFSLSLSGKIVAYGNMTASDVIVQLKKLQNSGSLIDYRGRNVASSMQIRSFETSHGNTIHGGADFSMELVQVRIAKSAYTPKKQTATTTTKKEETKTTNTTTTALKEGAKVVFKGGPVYESSTAKKKAATRSRSTCKITKITKLTSAHPYHLISTDGKNVYGWVDKADIETTETTTTSGKTNAGTQQVANGSNKAVYHTVKKGDTVSKLVSQYKHLGKNVAWVVSNNPNCFSKKGDAKTLKVGSRLLMGYR